MDEGRGYLVSTLPVPSTLPSSVVCLIRYLLKCLPGPMLGTLGTQGRKDKASVVSMPHVLAQVILIVNMGIWYFNIYIFSTLGD